ncbi:hypothetical protein CDEF62S_02704 [Castellaniella defragrans]
MPIAASLVIARLYVPSAFGVYSTWLAVATIVAVCVTYRLEHSLGLEADGAPRERLVIAAAALIVATGLVLLVIVAIMSRWLITLSGLGSRTLLLCLIPMSVGTALTQLWQSWAANNGDIRELSYMRVWLAASVAIPQVVVGWFEPTSEMLAASQVLGTWFAGWISFRLVPVRHGWPGSFKETFEWSLGALKKYRRFATLSLGADLTNALSSQLPLLVLTTRFGSDIAGYYALATRAMGAPISILGGAVRDVFKRAANEEFRRTRDCSPVFWRTFRVLAFASAAFVLVAYPLSETAFSLFFGENWRPSGLIAAWLLPMFALRFISSPLSYTLYITERQGSDLFWQIGLLIMTVGTLAFFQTYRTTLISYSAGYAVMYLVYLDLSRRSASFRSRV